jgi:hypothetical protein
VRVVVAAIDADLPIAVDPDVSGDRASFYSLAMSLRPAAAIQPRAEYPAGRVIAQQAVQARLGQRPLRLITRPRSGS